jgi:DNA-binding CsgD family transcriptional regulator
MSHGIKFAAITGIGSTAWSGAAMSANPACSARGDPEAAEITRFGRTALQASASIFFWVDGAIGMADIQLEGVPEHFFRHYAEQMVNLDPQHVHRMELGRQSVAQLRPALGASTGGNEIYGSFLGRYGIVDVIDLLFWCEGRPVAGLGLMKRPNDPPVCTAAIDTAFALQRFVEYNLRRHSRIAELRLRQVLMRDYQLTARESSVAGLVAEGHTNAEIAARLDVSLPTVKTHLLHVLAKTGCENRTRLAATLAGEKSGTNQRAPPPARIPRTASSAE